MTNPLNILVVDDTATFRLVLSSVVRDIPGLNLCGTAGNGRIALDAMEKQPVDAVLLDIEMPVMDGMQTLLALRQQYPDVGVVFVSGVNRHNADMTIKALEAGALDFIAKPDTGNTQDNFRFLKNKLSEILTIYAQRRKIRHEMPVMARTRQTPEPAYALTPRKVNRGSRVVQAVVIGVSTGGPKALMELVAGLPDRLGVPILIVQHMLPVFTASLAASLNDKTHLQVKEAQPEEVLMADTIYIAPGGYHLGVMRDSRHRVCAVLNTESAENSCRPAVDVLFRTAANVYGRNLLSVVMTGMGQDGMLGVEAIKRQDGYCLIQNEATCVVYGMPKDVAERGLADETIALPRLAERITSLIQSGR